MGIAPRFVAVTTPRLGETRRRRRVSPRPRTPPHAHDARVELILPALRTPPRPLRRHTPRLRSRSPNARASRIVVGGAAHGAPPRPSRHGSSDAPHENDASHDARRPRAQDAPARPHVARRADYYPLRTTTRPEASPRSSSGARPTSARIAYSAPLYTPRAPPRKQAHRAEYGTPGAPTTPCRAKTASLRPRIHTAPDAAHGGETARRGVSRTAPYAGRDAPRAPAACEDKPRRPRMYAALDAMRTAAAAYRPRGAGLDGRTTTASSKTETQAKSKNA
ncbi:hypothetical protein B0H17DRAFT_1332949 [Mycena rosella]|uniref:Uncharacterized protein n=1 Tax=Mycena rosella TaxID=1033263 RepID=A0AAD7DAR4_MYCRO|nr:hypothetical protein B0H17DRAFT_1332949 [Mycena rosella]